MVRQLCALPRTRDQRDEALDMWHRRPTIRFIIRQERKSPLFRSSTKKEPL